MAVTPFDLPYTKTHATRQPHGSIFYRSEIITSRRFTLHFAPVTLSLTRWPLYSNLTRIPWRYTGCANMNFLRQGFRKTDRQTDRQTDKLSNTTDIIHHTASRVVNKVDTVPYYIASCPNFILPVIALLCNFWQCNTVRPIIITIVALYSVYFT